MNHPTIETILENQKLRNEFKNRGLDLFEIWHLIVKDFERDNRELRYWLEFVDQFRKSRNRQELERSGSLFLPLCAGILPHVDWDKFKRWVKGESVLGTVFDREMERWEIIPSDNLSDEELELELRRMNLYLEGIGITVDFIDDLPPRLVYEYIEENLSDELQFFPLFDAELETCSGICPLCIRRPWCEDGWNYDWDEDREAGKIVFPRTVLRFVSPSPMSLEILHQRCMARRNA
jgi:hypothetical protein